MTTRKGKRPMQEVLRCKHGDRDVPTTVCGYPLPCPYHTIVIHGEKNPPTVEVPITRRLRKRERRALNEVATALTPCKERPIR
jgi:hypothetical protein